MIIDKVFGNRCLVKTVKPHTALDEFEKSIVVPFKEEHTPRPSTGIIIQIGDQWEGERGLEPGDMIFFSKYAGSDFIIDEDDYRVLEFKEVLCKVIPKEGVVVE